MKTYKIYTERKNKKFLLRLFSESFPGFTMYEATGYWDGTVEKTYVFEIIADVADAMLKITRICKCICGYNKQDTVMLTESDCVMRFVGTSGILEEN